MSTQASRSSGERLRHGREGANVQAHGIESTQQISCVYSSETEGMQAEPDLDHENGPCKDRALLEKCLRQVRSVLRRIDERHSGGEMQPVKVSNQVSEIRLEYATPLAPELFYGFRCHTGLRGKEFVVILGEETQHRPVACDGEVRDPLRGRTRILLQPRSSDERAAIRVTTHKAPVQG